jgi:hypothetical protein
MWRFLMTKPEAYRDTYELWVKFLQESKKYSRYCEKKRGIAMNKTFAAIARSGRRRAIAFAADQRKHKWSLPEMYEIFGDVFENYDFEVWWQDTMLRLLKLRQSRTTLLPIKEITYYIDVYAQAIKDSLCAMCGQRESNVSIEKIENLLRDLFKERKGFIALQIDTHHPLPRLQEKFATIITKHQGRTGMTPLEQKKFVNLLVPTPIPKRLSDGDQISAVKKYLTIYKLKQPDKTFKDVIQQLEPNLFYENSSYLLDHKQYVEQEYITHNRYARNLKRNAEQGVFPGDYREVAKKKKIKSHQ